MNQIKPLKVALVLMIISGASVSYANTFMVADKSLETKDYYNQCGDKCPEIRYQLVDTGHVWLDTIINKAVVSNLALNDQDDSPTAKRWQAFKAIAQPSTTQLTKQLDFAISELVKSNLEFRKQTSSDLNYAVSVEPSYLGHKTLSNGNDLELFAITSEQYLGGAHGMHWTHFYLFDRQKKRQITLNDIVIAKQRPALEELVKAQYQAYLKKNNMNPDEMKDMWTFFLTDNVTFTNRGLTFLYQPYEITPYVMGMPEFTIPYAQLTNLIKADYLP